MTPNPNENQAAIREHDENCMCHMCLPGSRPTEPRPSMMSHNTHDPMDPKCGCRTCSQQNENQAEKHSAEPWKINGHAGSGIQKSIMVDGANSRGTILTCHWHSNPKANAARIVACVNFCAGIHIETLTLLNQANHPTLQQICERNQSLEAELSTLRKELEAAKRAQEWLMENGKYILERSGFLNERHEIELRELLNNGKD